MLAPPIHQESRSTLHVCSRHGRERAKILEQKPVKPSRSIQPKPVKPVRQTSFHAPTPKETSAVKSGNRAETSVSDLLYDDKLNNLRIAWVETKH